MMLQFPLREMHFLKIFNGKSFESRPLNTSSLTELKVELSLYLLHFQSHWLYERLI